MQKILHGFLSIAEALTAIAGKKYMLVCDSSFQHLPIKDFFDNQAIPHVVFNQFSSNPLYEDVCKGIALFNAENCDTLIAVGGGSAIDVAKCIKLYCRMDHSRNYLEQECANSGVPLIAVPTTAGTGSESTKYAVIYYKNKKQSITHESIVPECAILEPDLLKSLPLYQKKCTMLDALCQGIESLWSINSTDESMIFSKIAIDMIINHWHGYIEGNNEDDAKYIMMAANYAGRAINITQTTAPHAMSYKLTSMYGLPHGHAVALCLPEVWLYMMEHPEKCIDSRGQDHLEFIFEWLGQIMQCDSAYKALMMFRSLMFSLDMPQPQSKNRKDELNVLTESVNPVRLKNNPVKLDDKAIHYIYDKILL
ncbi:MAG: phosphonoacetaldehyde reductase [Bacteroidales bacterium]|nr:phosphonoacetaldehyde reductase [Bacteroidales bacterium]